MKPKKTRPPRTVPVLAPAQEALLSAITDNGKFTLEAALARHAKVTAIASKLSDPDNAHISTKEAAHRAFAHLKKASIARTLADASVAALPARALRET